MNELPKFLRHWVNSIPESTTCALANELGDVNASCLCDVIHYYFPKSNEGTTTDSDMESSAGKLRSALCDIADCIGWKAMPTELKDPLFPRLLCETGDSRPAALAKLALLNFVFKLSKNSFLADYHLPDRENKTYPTISTTRQRTEKKSSDMPIVSSSPTHPSSNVIDFRQHQFRYDSKPVPKVQRSETPSALRLKSEQRELPSQGSRTPNPAPTSSGGYNVRKAPESGNASVTLSSKTVEGVQPSRDTSHRHSSPIFVGTKHLATLKHDNSTNIQEVVSVSTVQDAYGGKSAISKNASTNRIAAIIQWLQGDLNLTLDATVRLPVAKNGTNSSSPLRGQLTLPTYLFRVTSGVHDNSFKNHQAGNIVGNINRDVRLADPWTNGTLLSQVIASLPLENKSVVKQVEMSDKSKHLDPYDRIDSKEKRLLLNGTTLSVKSRAQALMNIQVCLDYLQSHWPQHFSFLIADDLFASESAGWELFGKLFDIFATGNSSTAKPHPVNSTNSVRQKQPKEKSGNNFTNESASSATRTTSPIPAKSASTAAPIKSRHVQFSADDVDIGRVRFKGGKENHGHVLLNVEQRLTDIIDPTLDDTVPYDAIRALDIRRAEMRKERLAVRRRRLVSLESTGDGSAVKTVQKLHESPWDDRMSIVRPKQSNSGSPIRRPLDSTAKAPSNKEIDANANKIFRRNDATVNDWYPPKISDFDIETAQRELQLLPPITTAQQVTVRKWLEQLGLTLVDGEGGFFHVNSHPSASSVAQLPAVPLPIHADRVRNGELLCDLLLRIEPRAAVLAQLHHLVIRRPNNLQKSRQNLLKALWLIKIRTAHLYPPISPALLSLTDEWISGNKLVMWGLLWELMQVYTVSRPARRSSPAPGSSELSSAESKAEIDRILLEWLQSSYDSSGGNVLTDLLGRGHPTLSSIAELDGFIRDGTLLCVIIDRLLLITVPALPGIGQKWFHTRPVTYAQCWENVHKSINALRTTLEHRSKKFRPSWHSGRSSLFIGVEDKVLAGDRPTVIELLLEMRAIYLERVSTVYPESGKRKISIESGDGLRHEFQKYSTSAFGSEDQLDIFPTRGTLLVQQNRLSGDDIVPLRTTAFGSRGSDEAKVSKSGDADDWKLASLVDSLPLEAAAFDSDDGGGSDSDSSSDSNRDNNAGDGGRGVIIAEKTNARIVDIGFADSEWTTFSEAGLDYKKTKGIIKWAEGLGVRITVKDLEPIMEGAKMDNRILIPRILNHQFSDGVLISRLVQRLERSNPLPGFEPYPKNAAQRTQNLRRCIEHLARSNKKLRWQSLSFCEDDILQGNLKTTFTLLSDIKVAYTHR